MGAVASRQDVGSGFIGPFQVVVDGEGPENRRGRGYGIDPTGRRRKRGYRLLRACKNGWSRLPPRSRFSAPRLRKKDPMHRKARTDMRSSSNTRILICLFLAAGVLAVYGQVAGHGFINYDEAKSDRRFAACEQSVEQTQPLRLVGVVECPVDPYELEAQIRTALLSWKLEPGSGIKQGRVFLRQSNVDSIEVLKEELQKVKKFDKDLTFILFDFDVSIEISATCDAKTLIL